MTPAPLPEDDAAALRGEHDALARKLQVRASIDELRKAAYVGFVGVLALALALLLAADRWLSGTPEPAGLPLVLLAALAVAALLLGLAGRWVARARVHQRREDALFARFRELRARLELDR